MCSFVEVGSAGEGNERPWCDGAGRDPTWRCVCRTAEKLVSGPEEKNRRFECRCVDHAQDGFALLDECDVDGEFAVAGDELLGAVERVHQPEGLIRFVQILVRLLLRTTGNVGRQIGEGCDDEVVCSGIGA